MSESNENRAERIRKALGERKETSRPLGLHPHIPPTEEEVIANSKTGVLYSHPFKDGRGRFFQIVYQDETGCEIKVAPRTMLKVIYLKENDDIEGFEVIRLVSGKVTHRMKWSAFDLQQIRAFLQFISSHDLKAITDKRLRIADDQELDHETVKTLRTFLSKEGGESVLLELIDEGILTSTDMVNTAYRKRQLAIFRRMLDESGHWRSYARENSISESSEEKVWQHFFETNDWIFGYGLDYRFNGILQREFHASESQGDGSGTAITDFLLGDKRFTTFVEIKRPSTEIFGPRLGRSNAWMLSTDLFDAVSQILEHKASGQIRLAGAPIHDSNGDVIQQRAEDCKVILVIGNWDECTFKSDNEKRIKEKTFELFRRDSRNIKILTFDELYDRAKFIVEHKAKK